MRRLLIRPGAIGDCILCFPAMEYLIADYTEIWISSAAVPLVRFADVVVPLSATGIGLVGVGDVAMSKAFAEKLRSFDSIVSWYGAKNDEFRDAMAKLGIPCEFHRALPPGSDCRHAVDFFVAQVGAPGGLAPRISIKPALQRDVIVIHPFSGSSRKNWPLPLFRELAKSLPFPVEWLAGPEEDLPEAIRFDDLGELAAWLAGARLYIGNDSGITHLAAAIGAKTLALFASTDPKKWAPRGANVRVLQTPSIETVASAANRLLDLP